MAKVTWEQLYETVSKANRHLNWRMFFDKRQLQEIAFDAIYAEQFQHGTDGHNAKLIIAQMAELLDLVQENITFHDESKS